MSSESELVSVVTTSPEQDGSIAQFHGAAIRNRESLYLPASEFRGYEETVPGAGERLLAIFEKQVDHRIVAENKQIENQHEIAIKVISSESDYRQSIVNLSTFTLFMFFVMAIIFAICGMEIPAILSIIVPVIQGITAWIQSLRALPKEGKNQTDTPS